MPENQLTVEDDFIDGDFIIDLIFEYLEIHLDVVDHEIVGEIIEGDLPFVDRLEVIAANVEVRQVVAQKVSEAQAAGRAFPLPTAQDLTAARERRLARAQRQS